jgi:transposase
VHRFRNSKAAGSYAGLVPRLIESGQRSYHGPLVNHGNRELRFVLGEWAVQLLARHELVKQWAEPRLRRSPKNKVRVALARRLLVGVWHTLRTGEVFDLRRCLALS